MAECFRLLSVNTPRQLDRHTLHFLASHIAPLVGRLSDRLGEHRVDTSLLNYELARMERIHSTITSKASLVGLEKQVHEFLLALQSYATLSFRFYRELELRGDPTHLFEHLESVSKHLQESSHGLRPILAERGIYLDLFCTSSSNIGLSMGELVAILRFSQDGTEHEALVVRSQINHNFSSGWVGTYNPTSDTILVQANADELAYARVRSYLAHSTTTIRVAVHGMLDGIFDGRFMLKRIAGRLADGLERLGLARRSQRTGSFQISNGHGPVELDHHSLAAVLSHEGGHQRFEATMARHERIARKRIHDKNESEAAAMLSELSSSQSPLCVAGMLVRQLELDPSDEHYHGAVKAFEYMASIAVMRGYIRDGLSFEERVAAILKLSEPRIKEIAESARWMPYVVCLDSLEKLGAVSSRCSVSLA